MGAKFFKFRGTDALDPKEIVWPLERGVCALVQDPLRERRPDARESLELGKACKIRIELTLDLLWLSSGNRLRALGRFDGCVQLACRLRIPFQYLTLGFQGWQG